MARPTDLTPELQQKIVTYITAGAYVETAAKAAGLHKSTLYDWLKRGAKAAEGDEAYVEFSDAVEKALGQSEVRDIHVIDKAAQSGQWQAAAWRLERKNNAQWGRRQRVELAGDPDAPVKVELTEVLTEYAAAFDDLEA